jgi:hypothetical protein
MAQAHRHREETVNTQLAILLSRHGVSADAETIHTGGQHRPDVMFTLGGLRVIIEGKFADSANAQDLVVADATKRIQAGICHIAVALVYPKSMRTVATAKLEATLSSTPVRFLVISENGQTEWSESNPAEILSALRRVHEALSKDDIVAESAKRLSEKIDAIAQLWVGQPSVCDKLSDLLGMPTKRNEASEEKEARRITATKVAALVLANAMIFQEQLAASGGDGRVDSLRAYDHDVDPIAKIKSHWYWIWTKINYVPIFQIGEKILELVPINQPGIAAVRWLISEAKTICANQSALRHDLMGRIYHWLLHNAKYLGTYYTATSSATLLLKLVFSRVWDDQDFGSPKKLVDFNVCDLACGTGTLLMAAAQAITDQFILSRVQTNRELNDLDLKHLHETLMENVLHGYDVLPSAVHLTASTLGMLSPGVSYRKMNLFVMPMGAQGASARLGSLDFIGQTRISTQLTLDRSELQVKRTGVASEHYTEAELPPINLCVMNPPFVRSVGGNLLFGSLPDEERAILQNELKRSAKNLSASITAGLGSVFLAIADSHLVTGGRIAFVLPVALATGESWAESRALLAKKYHVEMVIVSHDATRPNFSENTDLSEIMFIAKKLCADELPGETTYVNLWRNPRTIYEAMDIAERLSNNRYRSNPDSECDSVRGVDGKKLAEVIRVKPTRSGDQWHGVQFAQGLLHLVAAKLIEDDLIAVPGANEVTLPLCRLHELGTIGYDQRDIHDGFTPDTDTWSPYAAFWNHDATRVVSVAQKRNSFLRARSEPAPGRKLKDAKKLWLAASQILLVERVRTTSHRLLAVRVEENVLANTWWAFKSKLNEKQQKALLLWLNGSISVVMVLAHRVTTEGAWMKIKKPQWERMKVLDVRTLTPDQLNALAEAYDRLAGQELRAIAKLDVDTVRGQIDSEIERALALSDLAHLRALLTREPVLGATI